jgi:hypothetical protein
MLTVVYLSVDDNWNSFQPYNRLDTKNIAVENTLKKLLMQTKLKAKDEANAIIAAENVKNLQQQKLKFGVTSSKLLGLPYEDASAQLSTKSTIVASENANTKNFNKYYVSMVIITPTERYAVVDGRFVREGDVLMGDDKIKKISQGKIAVLQYDGKVNTINVSGS